MDVFLMIRRKKLTIFTDAKDTTTVLELKKMIEGGKENGEFEALDLTPYSSPPDLPDVMKSQETNGQEQMDQH
ncbi:hypothetical protein HF086_015852 [Spodoptera exigua]|uniref:Uncharacterized protein n=1 Tax=Spodoptera exigua TaxID=7107 RepID=A0A922S9L1_SPOEX|nr:hypothetical protein HF086_015852 [Spodoptera exigua]